MNIYIFIFLTVLLSFTNVSIPFFPASFISTPLYIVLPLIPLVFLLKPRTSKSVLVYALCTILLILISFLASTLLAIQFDGRVALKYITSSFLLLFFSIYVVYIPRHFQFFIRYSYFFLLANVIVSVLQIFSLHFSILSALVDLVDGFQNVKFLLKPNGLFPESSLGSVFFLAIPLSHALTCAFRPRGLFPSHFILTPLYRLSLSSYIIVSLVGGGRLGLIGAFLLPVLLYFTVSPLAARLFFYLRLNRLFLWLLPLSLLLLLFSLIFSFSPQSFLVDPSLITRSSLLISSIDFIYSSPFLPGLGSFASSLPDHLNSLSLLSPEINLTLGLIHPSAYGYESPPLSLDPKNLFALYGVDFGLIGLLSFVLIVVFIFFRLSRLARLSANSPQSDSSLYHVFVYCSFLAFLISAFLSSNLTFPFLMLPFALALHLSFSSSKPFPISSR